MNERTCEVPKKIRYSPYSLLGRKAPRCGALLEVTFGSGAVGYADCHPWTELGDDPLEVQLKKLSKLECTSLTRCSLQLALKDAESRIHKAPLTPVKKYPKSHFLITDICEFTFKDIDRLITQGFTHVKLKVGKDVSRELKWLNTHIQGTPLKWRLDFNERLTFLQVMEYLQSIEELAPYIDFIEDPCLFNESLWSQIQNKGWRVACDRQSSLGAGKEDAASVLIIKPAIVEETMWRTWNKQVRIVTSYLGHPIEQVMAAAVSLQCDPECKNVHGLLSHIGYDENEYSRYLNKDGPLFRMPPGYGCGFDEELKIITFQPLYLC